MNRIPRDAFNDYVALAERRSYEALARRYGVTKAAVAKRARQERWQEQLAEVEAEALSKTRERAVNDLQEVHARQLTAARYLQAQAIKALKDLPPERGIRAASALAIAWRHELLLLGEPTERTASIEKIIRHETQTLLRAVRDDDAPEAQVP